jgi:Rrf2 family cysteine metabolism transcriptional repressor
MKIFSDKVKYGFLAIFELAKNSYKGLIQIKEIAAAQNIPQNYLEQLLVQLKTAGIVESMRGAQGGYKLKKSAAEIRVIDIIEVLDGPLTIINYSKSTEIFKALWKEIEKKFKELLEITIEDLVKKEDLINERLFFQI